MRFTRMLLLVLLLLTATMIAAQESDSDGDGIADSQDFCPQFPGTADLAGVRREFIGQHAERRVAPQMLQESGERRTGTLRLEGVD